MFGSINLDRLLGVILPAIDLVIRESFEKLTLESVFWRDITIVRLRLSSS
jgi:hypothetical protein